MDIKKMSDKELIKTNREVFDSINNDECYGMNDMVIQQATAGELVKRGYEPTIYKVITWKKF